MTPVVELNRFAGDYLADTTDLSTEEHGAYILLLWAMLRNEGWVANDPARLASMTKVPAKRWPAVWGALSRFFDVKDGRLSQGRLLREIEHARGRLTAARENGRKGGLAKARVARNPVEVCQPSATDSATGGKLAPANGLNGGHKRDQRTGYAEPPPPGTVYPSGTVNLRGGGNR